MNDVFQQRLLVLRQEYEDVERELGELESRRSELKTLQLRISGAIEVLENLIQEER